jgi:hypothetical protein
VKARTGAEEFRLYFYTPNLTVYVEQQWTLDLSRFENSFELRIFMFVSRLYTDENT